MPAILSSSFISILRGHVASANYTSFYQALYNQGSEISALYIPGPTGAGIFGQLSHNSISDELTRDFFESIRTQISLGIAEGLLAKIESTRDELGRYRLLTDQEFLEEEVRIFAEDFNTLFEGRIENPADAYPGHDLIDFFNLDIEGATGGQTIIGSIIDTLQASGADNLAYPVVDGEIISPQQLVDMGGDVFIGPDGVFFFDAEGNIQPTKTGLFQYLNQLFSTDDLTEIDGVLYGEING